MIIQLKMIKQIDAGLYDECLKHGFSYGYVGNFLSKEDFLSRGLGFCVLHDGEIVGGASSYTIYTGGIEIDVAVRDDHQRKGLATACSAYLILECLDRSLYPSWDAANLESVGLAEKLGYHFDYEYICYGIKE